MLCKDQNKVIQKKSTEPKLIKILARKERNRTNIGLNIRSNRSHLVSFLFQVLFVLIFVSFLTRNISNCLFKIYDKILF